jgi:DnaJ-class molecular chaperone
MRLAVARKAWTPARKRYDPEVEGYGSPDDWARAFNVAMGFEEAQRVVREKKRTPREILGVGPEATWEEVRRAYKSSVLASHVDRAKLTGMTPAESHERMKECNAAFVVLKSEFGR